MSINRAVTFLLAALGVALAVAGLVVGLVKINVGGTGCGSPFLPAHLGSSGFDNVSDAAVCAPVEAQKGDAFGLLAAGIIALAVAPLAGRRGQS